METGNPKQVAVLCVMAVGAVGFLFTRLGGKAPSIATAVAQRTDGPAATGAASDLPIVVDAFSHPKLAPPKPRVETQPSPQTEPALPPATLAGSIDGGLPFVGEPSEEPIVRPVKEAPKEGKSPKTASPPEPVEIGLEATAGASDSVAFLTIAGADSQPFRPNDSIKGKVRLLRIEDGAVVVSGPKGELTINVGERKRI